MIYELQWKFICDRQKINQLANEIADKMTDEDFYWSKIEEMLISPEADQYLESLGIEREGKSHTALMEEIASDHFHQLVQPLNEYFEEIYSQFERFMTDIFSNEVISYSLNELEIESVDYDGDQSSVKLDFASEVPENEIRQFMQKVFEENCAEYNASYLENFYYEIDCPGVRYIPFKLDSQEAYNKMLRYLRIISAVNKVEVD